MKGKRTTVFREARDLSNLSNTCWHKEYLEMLDLADKNSSYAVILEQTIPIVNDWPGIITSQMILRAKRAVETEDIADCKSILHHFHLHFLGMDIGNKVNDKETVALDDTFGYRIYNIAYAVLGEDVCWDIALKLSENEIVQKLFVRNVLSMQHNLNEFIDILTSLKKSQPDPREYSESNTVEMTYAEVANTVLKLHGLIYGTIYQSHPFVMAVRWISRDVIGVCPDLGYVWNDILVLAGVPKESIARFIIFSAAVSNAETPYSLTYSRIEELAPSQLDSLLLNVDSDVKIQMTVFFSTTQYYDAFQYCLDNGWHTYAHSTPSFDFMHEVLIRNIGLKSLSLIAAKVKTFDLYDEKGFRILHHLISKDYKDAQLVNFVRWLVNAGKTSVLECSNDRVDLAAWCRKHEKPLLEEFILVERVDCLCLSTFSDIMSSWKICEETSYQILYPRVDGINESMGRQYPPKSFFAIRIIPSGKPSKGYLQMFRERMDLEHLDYVDRKIDVDGKGECDCLLIYRKSVESLIAKMRIQISQKKSLGKQSKPKFKPTTPELESADIAAIGGSGKDRPTKVKAIVEEKFETKFTDADRDKVYVDYHLIKCGSLYEIYSCKRGYDIDSSGTETQRSRMTLSEFRYRAMEILGSSYSEETVCIVFAQEYYNPKVASAFEKSKCAGHYAIFKNRHVEEVQAVAVASFSSNSETKLNANPLKDEPLVELVNPFKLLKEPKTMLAKKVDRPISINLQSAKHEFLFLKGLYQWKAELDKPLPIHDEIFEDCLRLGAVRFYNSVLLYSREVKGGLLGDFAEKISYDDSQASRLRNVLAHNFVSLSEIKSDVEKLLFQLGERVVDICNRVKVPLTAVQLAISPLYKMKVRVFDPIVDGSFCRNGIMDRLKRMKNYDALVRSKQSLDKNSEILKSLNCDWESLSIDLKIWIHHARAIESCILQIGELSKGSNKFLSKTIQDYILLCREVRHVGYHVNVVLDNDGDNDEWNFDPIAPNFLADIIEGCRRLPI